jgi:nucleotide-binding universal stress UspA family protein
VSEIREILVPLDGSRASERAIPWAAALAGSSGASVTLLRVVPTLEQVIASTSGGPLVGPSAAPNATDLHELTRQEAMAEIERASGLLPRTLRIVSAIVQGDAGPKIVEHARTHRVDLIVMSTRGQGGLARAILGSVADQVVRSSPCPVLLVPPEAGA